MRTLTITSSSTSLKQSFVLITLTMINRNVCMLIIYRILEGSRLFITTEQKIAKDGKSSSTQDTMKMENASLVRNAINAMGDMSWSIILLILRSRSVR